MKEYEKLKRTIFFFKNTMKIKAFLIALILVTGTTAAFSFSDFFQTDRGDAALIELSGNIQADTAGGLLDPTGITPEQVRQLNEEAEQQNVDAIIYEINSGGGAVVASKDVKRAIDSTDIPTVCRLRDMGASGAYLMATGCDQIVADSATFTGSIGVTGSYVEFSDLMDDLGINYVNVTAGDRKEVGSPFQELSEEEEEILQTQVDIVHEEFYTTVDEERNLTDEQLDEIKSGQVYLGSEAEELGLVDSLGGREEAIDVAENETGLNLELTSVDVTPEFSWLSLLTMDASEILNSYFQSFYQSDSPLAARY